MRRRSPLMLFGVVALSALTVGCGADEPGRQTEVRVAATTGFAAELARAVAGEDAKVAQIVPASASPHSYGASARDRAAIASADLVVAFGFSYEEGLPLEDAGAPLFEIAERVVDEAGEADSAASGTTGKQGPEEGDPHVWMDPVLMAEAAGELADELARIDPGGAPGYRDRAERHAAALRALHGELRRTLRVIPAERRKLVTSHDSLAYFAERYDLEVVASAFGLAPEAEASARAVAGVISTIRSEGVPVIFGQQGDDPRVVARIAREAGVKVVDDLVIENPRPGQDLAATLQFDAKLIADALGP